MPSKLSNLLVQDKLWNAIVLFLMVLNIIFFISGCSTKVEDGSDTTVDSLKLCMVWNNIFLLTLLLFQKRILLVGSNQLKSMFIGAILVLNGLCFAALTLIYKVAVATDDKYEEAVGTQKDYLLLGTTLATDICYLILYILFKSTRASLIAVIMIVVEVIIFIAANTHGSDEAIDVANLVISFITGLLAVMLWSAKVALDTSGQPLELKDYFERDDLETTSFMSSDIEGEEENHNIHIQGKS